MEQTTAFYSCSVSSTITKEEDKKQITSAAEIAMDEAAQLNTAVGLLATYLDLSKQDYTLADFRWDLFPGREVKFYLLPQQETHKSDTHE